MGAEGGRSRVGVVAIGRNEGQRLQTCLESAKAQSEALVYVDSGSTDESVAFAEEIGASVVLLDPETPFTAARARNAGFARLIEEHPELEWVQFIDGDCELTAGWIERALPFFSQEGVVVVCGQRRERYPKASVYNLLCDMEWDTPIGEADACGGDALMRVAPFQAVGGYSDDLIAGEEPELCVRLKAEGGQVLRIDETMTLHDARIFSFRQWWTRSVRTGHAEAEGAWRHPDAAGGRGRREVRSVVVWSLLIPFFIAAVLPATHGLSLGLLLLYPVQVFRIAHRRPRPNFSARENRIYAAACVLGKFPNIQGQLRFRLGRLTGRRSQLIEYKKVGLRSDSDGAA